MQDGTVAVINYTSRCVNHIAAGVADDGALRVFVRPYANQDRPWEKALARLPLVGAYYEHSLGRRRLPSVIDPSLVREARVGGDFMLAIAARAQGQLAYKIRERLHWKMQYGLGSRAAVLCRGAETVISSYIVALPTFETTSGLKILSYPIAHHRYSERVLREEQVLEPEFAATLDRYMRVPEWVKERQDLEIEAANAIVVGSSFAKQSFVAEGVDASKIAVVPYGVDCQMFGQATNTAKSEADDSSRQQQFKVLYVGQLDQRKGISYLLRAYDLIRGPGTKLTLVGNMFGKANVFHPYEELFDYFGHVPQSALVRHYQSADVFCFPSLIEGMPLVVLEAMASGLPVIVTATGPEEVVRDGVDGFVVQSRRPDLLAERIERLRSDPYLRMEMGRNARERAREFSWAEFRRGVKTLYDPRLRNMSRFGGTDLKPV
jgi:glycosyltransferase involved in cell wall biosynthesis